MRAKKEKEKRIIGWSRREDNVGVMTTRPRDYLSSYLCSFNKSLQEIINLFWASNVEYITIFDFCTLVRFWWSDEDIKAARLVVHEHPKHADYEYIFDKIVDRLIIKLRQPDLDGKHWKTRHFHLLRGQINSQDPCLIVKPNFSKHVEIVTLETSLSQSLVGQNFKFFMKIKDKTK